MIYLVLKKPLFVVCCWFLMSILGIAALCFNGADAGGESPEDSVYAQIEFESGLYIEKIDMALAEYGSKLKTHEGIKSVQTVARTGTGSTLVSFDPQLINNDAVVELMRNISPSGAQLYLFILALLFCYMIIAALKESFTFPLALLAVVPPSLSVPALYMVLSGYPINAVSAAAFVAALTADALEHAAPNAALYYGIYRRRLPVLTATTLTTVAAALPFLFIKSNAALIIKTLALVSAAGVAVSAICAITLIPALVKLFLGLLMRAFAFK